MDFNTTTNLVRNIVSISILLVTLFYQRDESSIQNKYTSVNKKERLNYYQEKLLKNRVHAGFLKHSAIRLQQTINDSRQL